MEKKFDHPYCLTLFKHFVEQYKNFNAINIVLAVFFTPGSLLCLFLLEILTFLRALVASIFKGVFDYVEAKGNEHVAYKIAVTVVFAPFMMLHFLLSGVLGVTVFIFGFGYDISNTLMSLGKTETLFVNLFKKEDAEEVAEEYYYTEE